jgi:hypothetical protein
MFLPLKFTMEMFLPLKLNHENEKKFSTTATKLQYLYMMGNTISGISIFE